MKKAGKSQASISINPSNELSKTQFSLWVSLKYLNEISCKEVFK